MGLFDFNNSRPNVSGKEFSKEVKNELHNKGFSHRELEQLEGYFHGSMHEHGSQKGIDEHEIDRTVGWLRENKSDHRFDDKQIDHIEHALRKHL